MDTDWCLTCGRRTNEGNEAYCSKICMNLDRSSVAQSLPIHVTSRRPSFDVPIMSPPRRTSHTRSQPRRVEARACTSDGFPREISYYNKARFRDDELQDEPTSTFVTTRWTGKDRDGILVWAHAVFPGLEEECASPTIDTASMPDLDTLLSRPPSFPLTAQNLAPPCVTVAPRHVLLNHTSMHSPSHPEDRTAPSLSQDDASLLTPATESVITPSPPDMMSPPSKPLLGRIVSKVSSWIVTPSRIPRATPEGNPTSPSADDRPAVVHSDETARYYASPYSGDKSSAPVDLSLASGFPSSRVRL